MMAASSSSMLPATADLIQRLYDVDAVKFGDFTLKSGIQSPIYFDLRVMISFPQIMLMSSKNQVPMLIRRKEAKDYGTKKLIEGRFSEGDKCLIVEDVVSSGSSVSETAKTLQDVGIKVTDAVVLLNRQQGGSEKLKVEGITLHSVFTMSDILTVLNDAGKLELELVERIKRYIADNEFKPNEPVPSMVKSKILSFSERSALSSNPIARRLFEIMETKKSNLALSADVTKSSELIQLVEKTGPHICLLKTHVDIIEDFSQEMIESLKALAAKHNFLLFEDRKFADIGNTVVQQYAGGIYHISEWADIINAHTVPGPGVVNGLKKIGAAKGKGCLLIAEMSSAGNLATGDYTKATVKLAEEHKDFVMGFISLGNVSSNQAFIHMTPGVQLQPGTDALGQQYLTPSEVITKRGSDVIIVGRGIYQAQNPKEAAQEFQLAAYSAYKERLVH